MEAIVTSPVDLGHPEDGTGTTVISHPGSLGSLEQMGATEMGELIAERYELGPLLGRGGMADVHAGTDRRLRREVAIKLLRSEMAARADVRRRFEAEALAAARLTHPNAVAVFDTGEHDGTPYIVMERLPGETLADRMAAGPVEPEWLVRVAVDVLGALGAAHAAGIVHRDVKPANILLTSDGGAKIADFGIAKSLDTATTSAGHLIGTPAYIAPERLDGGPASPMSDLYSLGVVLYEGLAGGKPFTGDAPLAVAHAIQRGVHQPLGAIRPDLDPRLTEVVERAMALQPELRYPSADAMAGVLEHQTTNDATQVLPVAPDTAVAVPVAPRRGRGRTWTIVAAIAAGLLVLAALIVASAGGDHPPPRRSPAAPTTVVTVPPAPTAPPTTVASVDTRDGRGKGNGRGKGKGD
jgi:protein kinase-like protein